jgi:phosphomannomutase
VYEKMDGVIYRATEYMPNECMDIGRAIGSLCGAEKMVLTARDGKPVSRYVRRAVVIGLASVGVSSLDLRMVPVDVLRYEIQNFKVEFGIYALYHNNELQIIGFDENGNAVGKGTIKSIKEIIKNGNYEMASVNEIGASSYYPNALDDYINKVVSEIKFSKPLKTLVDCQCDPFAILAPPLLAKYGIKVFLFNDFLSGYEPPKPESEYINILRNGDYQLGIKFNRDFSKGIELLQGDKKYIAKDIIDALRIVRDKC